MPKKGWKKIQKECCRKDEGSNPGEGKKEANSPAAAEWRATLSNHRNSRQNFRIKEKNKKKQSFPEMSKRQVLRIGGGQQNEKRERGRTRMQHYIPPKSRKQEKTRLKRRKQTRKKGMPPLHSSQKVRSQSAALKSQTPRKEARTSALILIPQPAPQKSKRGIK